MTALLFSTWLLSALIWPVSQGYNILVFSFGISNSHVLFDARLANILAEENGRKKNNVTFLVEQFDTDTKKAKLSKFIEEIRFDMMAADKGYETLLTKSDEVYGPMGELLLKHLPQNAVKWHGGTVNMNFRDISTHGFADVLFTSDINMTKMSRFIDMLNDGCEAMLQDELLLDKLRSRKFDIAVAHMASLCPVGLVHALSIPTYVWSSSGLMIDYLAWESGAPSPPSFVPQLMSAYTDRMTFWQRCRNFAGAAMLAYFYRRKMVAPANQIFRNKFGPDFPDVARLAAKSSLLLVNSEELLDYPRPILHKILYIGGVGLSEPGKLDNYWTDVVEDRTYRGVVIFSLGSIANTSLMPYDWKKIFVETFAQFPDYKIVWKFDGDLSMFRLPENVVISKWLPQVDLFGHPNVKAFITHAGFNSILEASTYGVPLVTIPLFADQFSNFKRAERRGTALMVEKSRLSVETLSNALRIILTNESYTQNAKRLSKLIRRKPSKPAELIRQWIEYVAENGGLQNLEPASIDLNFVEYFSIDVILVASTAILCILLIITLILKKIILVCKFARHKKID